MAIALTEEQRMLRDLVAKFVRDEMMPLENKVLARDAEGKGMGFTEEEQGRLDARSKELGLWGLDAPEEFGGADLPVMAMVGVNEELGQCALQYRLPPESPHQNLVMNA